MTGRETARAMRVIVAVASALTIAVSSGCDDAPPPPIHYKRKSARRVRAMPVAATQPAGSGADILSGDGSSGGVAAGTDNSYNDPLDPTNSGAKLGQDTSDDTIATGIKQKMPTQHSHWLKIAQFQSHITVRLNGVWYGEFYGAADRDITMSLQAGQNTITVTYQPQSPGSWMDLKVLESEHDPPIPPLVTFAITPNRTRLDSSDRQQRTPTTKMFTFDAK